jgi:hypothetical protein
LAVPNSVSSAWILYLGSADQGKEQLVQIAMFLRDHGFSVGESRKLSNAAAYALRIADQNSVVRIAEMMAPFCHKKIYELTTIVEYRKHDSITASEVQRRFERLVELGIRERHGKRRFRPMPWSYRAGYHLSRRNIWLLAHRPRHALTEAQRTEALERHKVFGESISALSWFYGVSRSAMARILKNA